MSKLVSSVMYVLLALVQAVIMPFYVLFMGTAVVALAIALLCAMPFVGTSVAVECGKRVVQRWTTY